MTPLQPADSPCWKLSISALSSVTLTQEVPHAHFKFVQGGRAQSCRALESVGSQRKTCLKTKRTIILQNDLRVRTKP